LKIIDLKNILETYETEYKHILILSQLMEFPTFLKIFNENENFIQWQLMNNDKESFVEDKMIQ
jgi:hypothetical protein